MPGKSFSYSQSDYRKFKSDIIDYQGHLNPKFKKKSRKKTRYIIVHTSELGLSATLRVVSEGKQFKNGRSTPGGHANYVIARNGVTYQIMDKQFRSDHAGLSMWNGQNDISSVSLGIELVGHHYAPLTSAQYRSVAMLIDMLQKAYGLDDKAVLTHSQVAYGRPNPWFNENHRGRKRCAKNFNRSKAGVGLGWQYDPDIRAGRLMPDPQLATLFYGKKTPIATKDTPGEDPALGSNVISRQNTAWSIAGDEYNSPTTAYVLADGRVVPGDQVEKKIGWDRIPAHTRVLLNQENNQPRVADLTSPVKIISDNYTAWFLAGPAYRDKTTIYFLPSGKSAPGSRISDWDDLPKQTKLILGYRGPFNITDIQTAFKIAGHHYKDGKTVYYLPRGELICGDQITDFSNLPRGTQVYLPAI
ncbi:N-acetylmuramoyl-L-alanine amidase [Desulforapulum autotrophicum]|nr:peptidoglycan recognition family protein [Desulforapulum autotrophicum]